MKTIDYDIDGTSRCPFCDGSRIVLYMGYLNKLCLNCDTNGRIPNKRLVELGLESKIEKTNIEKTTDLDKLKKGHPFTWGSIEKIHDIDEYSVVEYLDQHHERLFHSYLRNEDTHRSHDSLDDALACCIALKWDGLNTQADVYFMRALKYTD